MAAALPVLFETTHFAVLDKPAGLACHGGPRTQHSVEDFLPPLRRGKEGPWLAHRLDAGTSGCLLIARRKTALVQAQALFAAGGVQKTYWAVVSGGPAELNGFMQDRLAKRSSGSAWRMVVADDGQPALTGFTVLGRHDGLTLLALFPRTGRTHQLRVQCAARGFPILGDAIYGGVPAARLMLHARALRIESLGLAASAPLPAPLAALGDWPALAAGPAAP